MFRLLWVLATVVALGCGNSGSGEADSGAADTGADTTGPGDVHGPEGAAGDVDDADVGERDAVEDVPSQQEVILECREDGGFGCACDRNNDCNSGLCIDTMQGMRCTAVCQNEDSCPPGWVCGVVSGSGPDVIYGCVDPFARLCQPCVGDTECVPLLGVLTGKYACVERGDSGSFCGVPCASNRGCPYGFECGMYVLGGVNVRQCRPTDDAECPCTDKFRDHGYLTVCHHSNVYGRCPGERTCDAECSARWPEPESCDGVDQDCDGATDEDLVRAPCDITNELGTCKGLSLCVQGKMTCEGAKAVPEVCNGADDDCNGIVDDEDTEGCFPHYLDMDGDGSGIVSDQKCLCGPKGNYRATRSGDCNDEDPQAYPGAAEVCNGQDDNCDDRIDEMGAQGCINYYRDDDGDGRGVDGDVRCMCEGVRPYTATLAGDCDDKDPDRYPGNTEVCNLKDDNCADGIDEDGAEGCTIFFMDADRDGSGNSMMSRCMCKKAAPWDAPEGGDCNDNNFNIRPGRVEICNQGIDDDCDGLADPEGTMGCQIHCIDKDNDGFGDIFDKKCLCAPVGKYTITRCSELFHDCDDGDGLIFPGAAERCSTPKDDNCDGNINEAGADDCMMYYLDKDGDGYGVNGTGLCLCRSDGFYRATKDGDCDDNEFTLNPGAQEQCGGVDENCNGVFDDEGAAGCRDYYLDEDGDGFGAEGTATKCFCEATGNYRGLYPGDCCDKDGRVYPGQSSFFSSKSACGSYDFNCDSVINQQFPDMGKCSGWPSCPGSLRQGWDPFSVSSVPVCGGGGAFITDCNNGTFSCDKELADPPKTQGCR